MPLGLLDVTFILTLMLTLTLTLTLALTLGLLDVTLTYASNFDPSLYVPAHAESLEARGDIILSKLAARGLIRV